MLAVLVPTGFSATPATTCCMVALADDLTGGAGGDMFVFGNLDRVLDFNASEGDQIAFNGALAYLADITVTVGATGTTVSGNQTMTLEGVTQPFDLGNAFDFGAIANFDFLVVPHRWA